MYARMHTYIHIFCKTELQVANLLITNKLKQNSKLNNFSSSDTMHIKYA